MKKQPFSNTFNGGTKLACSPLGIKKSAFYDKKTPFSSWDTRTRTKNDRTRICSVTITPYPKIKYGHCLFAFAKLLFFFDIAIISGAFFLKKQIYSIIYAFCSYLALTL